MGRKKKIQPQAETAGDLFRFSGTVPPPVLAALGFAYYRQHAAALSDELERGGADASTIAAVIEDYRAACWGFDGPTAKPGQMEAALDALNAIDAYRIDAAAFFPGVYLNYKFNLEFLADYRARVQAEGVTVEARRDYFAAQMNARAFRELRAGALCWLRLAGVLRASDFAGMDTAEIGRVLDWIDRDGAAFAFAQYVYIARDAFGATPELLAQLTPPEPYTEPADGLAFADYFAGEFRNLWADVLDGMKQAAAGEQSTPEQGKTSTGRIPPIVKMAPKLTALNSRDIWATFDAKKDGETAKNLLPIAAVIDDFCARHPDNLPVSSYIIQKAVEGVNLLSQIKKVEPVNGIYSYNTNLSEFAGLCSTQKDVNDEEKKQILTALLVVDGLFCVIWTPRGPVAQRILTVEQIGKATLRLHVYASAIHGRPYLVGKSEYLQLSRGAANLHFSRQILHKGHKEENALIVEVFGYDTARAMAERSGDASQIAAVKEYQRKHKARDGARLLKMFERHAAAGCITYTREQNPAGNWVYSWERITPPTADELADAEQEPDEQAGTV